MLIDYYYVIYVINESEHVSFKREKIFKFLFNGTVLHAYIQLYLKYGVQELKQFLLERNFPNGFTEEL